MKLDFSYWTSISKSFFLVNSNIISMTGQFIVKDPFFKKAKALGYRARSAFKLIEIDEKFHLLHPKMHVLDLASAPGSFLQVISEKV